MTRPRPVVAIDGPAGAGKTTVARGVARTLGYVLVDTGAIYRTIAYAMKRLGIRFDDRPAVEAAAEAIVRADEIKLAAAAGAVPKISYKGSEIGDEIRSAELSMGASTVSAHPGVRVALLELQRTFGAHGGVVLEGRDIGTVVFPDAEVKVFLTATDEQRAGRRHREMTERGTPPIPTLEQVLIDVRARDRQDSERAVAPLRAADDAMTIDCSAITADEVIARIVALVKKRGG